MTLMSLMRGAAMPRPTRASCSCDRTSGVAAANNPALATDFNKSRRCIDIANPHTPSTGLIRYGSAAHASSMLATTETVFITASGRRDLSRMSSLKISHADCRRLNVSILRDDRVLQMKVFSHVATGRDRGTIVAVFGIKNEMPDGAPIQGKVQCLGQSGAICEKNGAGSLYSDRLPSVLIGASLIRARRQSSPCGPCETKARGSSARTGDPGGVDNALYEPWAEDRRISQH